MVMVADATAFSNALSAPAERAQNSGGEITENRPFDAMPEWFEAAMAALDHLYDVGSNWDSYGALPIAPPSIEHARAVLRELVSMNYEFNPSVTATPAGHAAFSWDWEDLAFECEVLTDGTIEFSAIDRAKSRPPMEGHVRSTAALLAAVLRFQG